MPISYNKQPFTLQEKVDKALAVTYDIRNPSDAEFMRGFIVDLIEKAFKKSHITNVGSNLIEQGDAWEANQEIDKINKWIEETKRSIQ